MVNVTTTMIYARGRILSNGGLIMAKTGLQIYREIENVVSTIKDLEDRLGWNRSQVGESSTEYNENKSQLDSAREEYRFLTQTVYTDLGGAAE
jgi:hypothetical protein